MQVAARLASLVVLSSALACGGKTPEPATPQSQDPAAAPADPGSPSTTGELSADGGAGTPLQETGTSGESGRRREDIQAAVMAKRDQARSCYDTAQKANPTLEGDIAIQWVIDPQGVVTDPKVDTAKTTLQDPKLGDCIIGVIKSLKFPASGKGMETRANYPFNFHPKTTKSNTGH